MTHHPKVKNLVLVGFGNIEIVSRQNVFSGHTTLLTPFAPPDQIDLDTIDLSNLNRQFLFRKADIKKPKAIIAAAFAHNFNPGPGPSAQGDAAGVKIKARHGNIKEEENDVMWMKGFDMVLSALDNLGMWSRPSRPRPPRRSSHDDPPPARRSTTCQQTMCGSWRTSHRVWNPRLPRSSDSDDEGGTASSPPRPPSTDHPHILLGPDGMLRLYSEGSP